MMKRRILVLLLLPILVSTSSQAQTSNVSTIKHIYELHYEHIDSLEAVRISRYLEEGRLNVIRFFNADYHAEFDVCLFSDRDSLDKQWQKDWNMPNFKSQCWMVASGIANRLDVLSPRVWETQACEHDVQDTSATRKLIIHEMIHVFHGQLNPSPAFENIDNMDWLVEGIAVYASGQLDEERYNESRKFVMANGGPVMLSDIWKGEHRYGLAGSIIKYIDDTYGRMQLAHLLSFTRADEVLDYLEISEDELIRKWKQYMSEVYYGIKF